MTSRLKLALAVSLFLNVFVLGCGLGMLMTGGRIIPGLVPRRAQPANIWVAAQVLPQPDRLNFRAMLRAHAKAVQPNLKVARLARRQAAALIAAPVFDPGTVNAALAQAQTAETQARADMDIAVVGYLGHLTAQERKALAEALVQAGPRRVRSEIRAAEPGARP